MTDPRSNRAGTGTGGGANTEQPLSELFSDLAANTQRLVKQEIALAKTELSQSAKEIGSAIAKAIAGALVLYTGVIFLLFAVVALLRNKLDLSWWVSALIVGGVVALIGLFLALRAKSQLQSVSLAPTATVETLKDDAAWAKGQMR